LLVRLFGAEIRYVETEDPLAPTTVAVMDEVAADVRRRGGQPYPMHLATYSGGRAALGYVAGALELAGQLSAQEAASEALVLAVGSGGTLAGLWLGLQLAGMRPRIMGVSVNLPAPVLRRLVAAHLRDAAALLGVAPPPDQQGIDITDAHIGPGYGVPTPESLDAVRQAAEAEGLLLDPVYTGKAWAALTAAVRRGEIGRDATVVFIHTGGAPNVFLHADALAAPGPSPPGAT
jgi:1-aminocyclopropane-1-carboxylate deaminase/D-cysteine desulfhydrase-like pyridoxal-dependent ACC family enzyme